MRQPGENLSWVVGPAVAVAVSVHQRLRSPRGGCWLKGLGCFCVPATAFPSASLHTHGIFLPALTLVARLVLGGRSPDFPWSNLGLRACCKPH